MAFTWTVTEKTVYGNHSVHHGILTCDGSAGSILTDLSTVRHVQVTPKSAVTASGKWRVNALESGTSTAGALAATSVTSGDEYFVTVYGR